MLGWRVSGGGGCWLFFATTYLSLSFMGFLRLISWFSTLIFAMSLQPICLLGVLVGLHGQILTQSNV